MTQFIRTDDNQFIRHDGNRQYTAIEIMAHPEYTDKRIVGVSCIDLDDYTETEILEIIDAFGYTSLADVTQKSGSQADQIIAECISESQRPIDYGTCLVLTPAEVIKYLAETYAIEYTL